jgi:hypothetical protein
VFVRGKRYYSRCVCAKSDKGRRDRDCDMERANRMHIDTVDTHTQTHSAHLLAQPSPVTH